MTDILYEDDEILAIDKAEGLLAVPDRRRLGGSLSERLCAERGEKLYIVHRIDKETSGVIVFAKNTGAHRHLNRQFETRSVQKVYLALVHGVIGEDQGEIDKPLRQFGSGRVGVDPRNGKPSITEFRIVQRLEAFTLVEARPRTGRRHQIRVHFYSLGHPIVGDPLYGDKALQRAYSRLMLHAWRLRVYLRNGDALALEAAIPKSFRRILQTLGGT